MVRILYFVFKRRTDHHGYTYDRYGNILETDFSLSFSVPVRLGINCKKKKFRLSNVIYGDFMYSAGILSLHLMHGQPGPNYLTTEPTV